MDRTARSRFVAGIAVVAALAIACGAGEPSSPGAGGSPSPSSAATPAGSGAAPTTPPCPNFVEVVETGPMPTDFSEDGPVAREQQRLSADMDAVNAYAGRHRDEFASIRFENGPRVRIVVGFTDHVEQHCAALRTLLAFPDEFEIIRQAQTEDRLEQIQGEIVKLGGPELLGVGIGAGTIDVQLRATGEAVADQIRLAYGDIVTIQVGLLPYPDRFAGDPLCGALEDVVVDSPLVATATLDVDTIQPGDDFRGSVRVTNTGTGTIDFETGSTASAIVFLPGSNRPVGYNVGGGSEMGFGAVLGPGDHLDIDVVGGTASCDPNLGYVLPLGRYDVRVPVERLENPGGPDLRITYILSEPLPLTIAP